MTRLNYIQSFEKIPKDIQQEYNADYKAVRLWCEENGYDFNPINFQIDKN